MPDYLEISDIPRINPSQHLFDRYGKPTPFTIKLFSHIVKIAETMMTDDKKIHYQGEEGRIHHSAQFQFHNLFDPDITYTSLLQTSDAKNNRFLQKFVKMMTNNKLQSKAAFVLYIVLNDILNYNKELYFDQLVKTNPKRIEPDVLRRIAERKYEPTHEKMTKDRQEGIRLLSLYKILAASNRGDKDLTTKFFREHVHNFPSDDKEILTDFIVLLDQYKKMNISARDLFNANVNPTMTDLLLYCFHAFRMQDTDFLEAFFINPQENPFIHKLIIMLYYFVDQKDIDLKNNMKFLLGGVHLTIQNESPQAKPYDPEVKILLSNLIQSIKNK